MEKLEDFVKEYDFTCFSVLPQTMKKTVNALRKLQLEHIKIQQQYHKEIQQLELKFSKLYEPLYEKRSKIINGEVEVTDEDCKLPENINLDEDDQENCKDEDKPFTPEEEKEINKTVKGLPGFWLGCLASTQAFGHSIEKYDRPILRHLRDIKLVYGEQDDLLTYTIEFVFDDNEFFTNKVLSKTYYLKYKPDEKEPLSYDGFEIAKSEGCKINWKEGKDVTSKTVTVKQVNKKDGSTREKKREEERDSFFLIFNTPDMPKSVDEMDEDAAAVMALDFELGECIRSTVIPKAVLLYDGHHVDVDLDEDEEDDDEEAISYDSDIQSDSDDSLDEEE